MHLTIPIDIQEQPATDDDLPRYSPGEYRPRGRTHADPALIRRAVTMLRDAERPVAIVGNAAWPSVDARVLRDFVETTGIPAFTVEGARGLISDDHPLCFGYADPALNDAAKQFRDADVVLLLGKRLDHRYRYGRPPFFNPAAKLIQIDPSPAAVGRNRGVSLGVVGDLGAALEQMTAEARGAAWDGVAAWVHALSRARAAQRERFDSLGTDDDGQIHPMRVLRDVRPLIADGTVVVIDGGDFAGWARAYLQAKVPGGWLRLGPLAQLGCGVPYALAAKLARPDADVVLFIGDGAFGFYGIEYDTAVRHGLAVTAVMGNDAVWGIDRNFQLAYYGRAVGTDLRPARYDKMVDALGAYGAYVDRADDIEPAVRRALRSGRPALVNIAVRNVRCPLADAMIARKTGRA